MLLQLAGLLVFVSIYIGSRQVAARYVNRAPPTQTWWDRCRHRMLFGANGSGKTSRLRSMVREDAEAGIPLIWLGLDGKECQRIRAICRDAGAEVTLLDAASDHPPPFNMLSQTLFTDAEREQLAEELVAVVRALNVGAWGPRLEADLDRATLSVLERSGGREVTPLDVLQDLEAEESPAAVKLERLLRTERLRRMLGTPGEIDLDLSPGQALILSLDMQGLGPKNAAALALVFASAIMRTGLLRSPDRPLAIYADEWQEYQSETHAFLLEQLRRYGVSVTAAMQGLYQARSERILGAILQVGSIYAYRASPSDGARLETLLGVPREQLTTLPTHTCMARETIQGKVRVVMQNNAQFGRPYLTTTDTERQGDRGGGADARLRGASDDSADVRDGRAAKPAGASEARGDGAPAAHPPRRPQASDLPRERDKGERDSDPHGGGGGRDSEAIPADTGMAARGSASRGEARSRRAPAPQGRQVAVAGVRGAKARPRGAEGGTVSPFLPAEGLPSGPPATRTRRAGKGDGGGGDAG